MKTSLPTLGDLKRELEKSPKSKLEFMCEHFQYKSITGKLYFNAIKYFPNFKMLVFAQEFKTSSDNVSQRIKKDTDKILSKDLLELIDNKTSDNTLLVYACDINFWGKKDNLRVLKEIQNDGEEISLEFSYEDGVAS